MVIQAAVLLAKQVDLAVLVVEVKDGTVLLPLVEQEIYLQLVQHKDLMAELVVSQHLFTVVEEVVEQQQ
tara:strand:+ start:49 stop:255 length:207 start_codon:yes stop_codon:yes gene_type:complete